MTQHLLGDLHLHLIGCGKMGSALLSRWLEAGIPSSNVSVSVASAASARRLKSELGVETATTISIKPGNLVILAVKPQSLPKLLENWAPSSAPRFYLSLLAGTPLAALEKAFGTDSPIIRAMPNTPSLVGEGMTSLCANGSVSDDRKSEADALFRAVGKSVWFVDEILFDAATAVAGSGPAYLFHFTEALIAAGEKTGLPADIAREMAVQTVLGSVALAEKGGWDVAKLRQDVTSPGGVTAAALSVLMDEGRGFRPLLEEALKANIARSKELAKS